MKSRAPAVRMDVADAARDGDRVLINLVAVDGFMACYSISAESASALAARLVTTLDIIGHYRPYPSPLTER